LTVKKVRGQNG